MLQDHRSVCRRNFAVLVAFAGLGLAAGTAYAGPTYDLADDFSITSNPNGVWSYGYTTTLGGGLILYTDFGTTSGVDHWGNDIALGAPSVEHNSTGSPVVLGIPVLASGQAAFHPGPNDEFSVLRFTAPSLGLYDLAVAFVGADTVGTTTDVHILLNGVALFNTLVSGFGPGLGSSYSTTLTLAAGDRVDFAVGFETGGNFFFDTTGVNASLTLGAAAVLEPSTWVLASLGGSLLSATPGATTRPEKWCQSEAKVPGTVFRPNSSMASLRPDNTSFRLESHCSATASCT